MNNGLFFVDATPREIQGYDAEAQKHPKKQQQTKKQKTPNSNHELALWFGRLVEPTLKDNSRRDVIILVLARHILLCLTGTTPLIDHRYCYTKTAMQLARKAARLAGF